MAEKSGNNKSAKKPSGDQPDENNLKAVAAVGYLGILFLIPMLMYPKNKFAMFHANQSLILLITGLSVSIVGSIIPILGWFLILPLGSLFVLILFIMGLINALNGKMKRLPLVGGFDILTVQE